MLTFAVGGTATLNARAFGHQQPPAAAMDVSATKEVIHDGGLLYGAQCAGCHGLGAVAGPLPDLRYASKAVHDQFEAIVLGGARSRLGMPSFRDLLNAEQVRAIQAYILSRAKADATAASR